VLASLPLAVVCTAFSVSIGVDSRAVATAAVTSSALVVVQSAAEAPAAAPRAANVPAERVDALLAKIFGELRPAGLAVAVVDGGQVAYAKALGVANVDTGMPVTTRSLFHLASVTKPVVATAIMQLVEQGRLGLDDLVTRHLPYFRLADESSTTITLRQLLTHTSGLPDVEDYQWDEPEFDEEALERYVRGLSDRAMRSRPGTQFAYSNIGFGVLADVIAKVTETPFEEWVASVIFEPLRMASSTLLYDEVDRERLVTPHTRDAKLHLVVRSVFPYNRCHAASSTLYSNVEDLSRWMLVNLGRGKLDGQRILADATYDQLWRPGTDLTGRIGLCWFLAEREREPTIDHSGSDEGFRSEIVLIPGRQIGVVALANCDATDVHKVVEALLDLFLAAKPR